MRITWLGHSCFRVESGESSLVLDPYQDGAVPGLFPLRTKADAVHCSHDHRDHGARENVALTGEKCTLTVETIDCFHDDRQGALRGKNRIHIVSDGEVRIAHLGDLGHIPDDEMLAKLRELDALLIPVGGYYTIDADTADEICDRVSPRVIVPMHYRFGGMGYKEIAPLTDFTSHHGNVQTYYMNYLDLTPATPPQTAVFTYHP